MFFSVFSTVLIKPFRRLPQVIRSDSWQSGSLQFKVLWRSSPAGKTQRCASRAPSNRPLRFRFADRTRQTQTNRQTGRLSLVPRPGPAGPGTLHGAETARTGGLS